MVTTREVTRSLPSPIFVPNLTETSSSSKLALLFCLFLSFSPFNSPL